MAEGKITTEYLFTVNDINRPMSIEGHEKTIVFIIRLILLEPGTYQSNPNMGVGIVSHYRYGNEDDLNALITRIRDQIETYLPGYNRVDVQIVPNFRQKLLILKIILDDVEYELVYDPEKQTLKL